MHTIRHEGWTCAGCGTVNDSSTDPFQKATGCKDNDVSICFTCGHIVVRHGARWCEPTEAEVVELAGDPVIVMLNKVRKMANEGMKKHGK